jgi:hypothetical protein
MNFERPFVIAVPAHKLEIPPWALRFQSVSDWIPGRNIKMRLAARAIIQRHGLDVIIPGFLLYSYVTTMHSLVIAIMLRPVLYLLSINLNTGKIHTSPQYRTFID